ncbi:MAG: hypothetical protein JO013_00095 [Alphaproteobacteria bacterium]|nr:hypothetical protein [Alphaproteobacteria bacterium]
MSLSPQQAAAALDDIDCVEQRTYRARGYAIASPYLILWGLIWIAGYGACAVLPPERWGMAWLPLVIVGALGSTWFGMRARSSHAGSAERSSFGQAAVMGLAIFAFIAAVYYLFQPQSPLPYLIFPSFVAGLVYALAGAVARMPRFVWIGAGVFLLTLGGYAFAPQWSAIWAAAGGCGLVAGGLWLRTV